MQEDWGSTEAGGRAAGRPCRAAPSPRVNGYCGLWGVECNFDCVLLVVRCAVWVAGY